MSYSYAAKTGSLKEFLQRIKSKELGVPPKVTTRYLVSIGYKSVNDRPIIRVLKSIGFLNPNGVSTQNFKDFRTARSAQIMATALRKTYADLFTIYPNPVKQGRKELENFFAEKKTKLKKHTLGLFVDTFKSLCEFADFGAVVTAPTPRPTPTPTLPPTPTPIVQLPVTKEGGINLNVSIRFELPATQDVDVYDKIFKSLKKHLLTPSSKED